MVLAGKGEWRYYLPMLVRFVGFGWGDEIRALHCIAVVMKLRHFDGRLPMSYIWLRPIA